MRKVLSFSAFLIIGLLLSQFLPSLAGEGYAAVKTVSSILLYVCLSFIMINVGREFEVDKTRWRSYAEDYFIAMATAAMPWFLIALYYVFVLLPPEFWNSWEAWKENLLLSRFAAPTSAGILFTMLAAIGLKSSWIYKKIQVLAIFDDLDTILLMIPLQIMMIGMRWQLIVVIFIVFLLLSLGWKQLGKYNWRQDWKAIMGYSVLVFVATGCLLLQQAVVWRRGQHSYRSAVAGFCSGYDHETQRDRYSGGAQNFDGSLVPVYVFSRTQYAAFYWGELCRDACRNPFGDRLTGNDVMGNDNVACVDCFTAFKHR